MCVQFQLSVSESSRDIKGIVRPAGSVCLQTRVWHIWPRFHFSASVSILVTTRLRYSLLVSDNRVVWKWMPGRQCGVRTQVGRTNKCELNAADWCCGEAMHPIYCHVVVLHCRLEAAESFNIQLHSWLFLLYLPNLERCFLQFLILSLVEFSLCCLVRQ